MATTNGVQANAGKALFKEASENPKKLKSQAASNQSKEKEVAVTFGVQQLNQLGEAMATIDGLELDKMQKVFQNFPFDRSGVTAGLKDRILEKYPKAAEVQEKPNQQRELVRRKGSTGSVARKYIVQTGGNTSLRSSTLKAAFLEWAESPSNRTEDDSEFIYSVAEWAIKQTSDEVINKCQAFFENLPAEKTVGFTEEQKQVITIFRLEKEFGDVEALESMERAKEFAWVHFSDAIEEKEFAGKQRVLHSLVAQKDEGLLGVIGTLMGELRKLQKEYYAKNHYIGKRQVKEVAPATAEMAVVELFGTDARSLKVHRALGKAVTGVEWDEAVCKELTADELSAILQAQLQGDFKKQVVAQVIEKKLVTLRGKIDWKDVDVKVREQVKEALFAGEKDPKECMPLVQGLGSEQVQKVFGKGKLSAQLHTELKLPQKDVKWERDAYEALEGEAYVQCLQNQSDEWERLEQKVQETLANKTPETQALVFVAYKGKVTENIDWSQNEALTTEKKNEVIAHYCDNPSKKPPECLKPHCETAQYRKLFGYSLWEKLGAFLLLLAGIFGLYQLYQRRKKS